MSTFENFTGINNVLPTERMAETDLAVARNVDLGLTGEASRRAGYSLAAAGAHTNLFAGSGLHLATVGPNGDLCNLDTAAVLHPSLGHTRVWYVPLPNGTVGFSNDLICGITDGITATEWGVPRPAALGAVMGIAGALYAGEYRYGLSYVRRSDGREGGVVRSEPFAVDEGGIFLSSLPALEGYDLNIYLSSHNDGQLYYAGSTANAIFSFTQENRQLVLPCRTEFSHPATPGRCLAFWRGRTLIAEGGLLTASRPNQWDMFDVARDFKQFPHPITAVVPVDDGIFIGTTTELAFLTGVEFDKLQYRRLLPGGVVLGSAVAVPGELVKRGDGTGAGSAMICIADRMLVAAFGDGGVVRLSEGRYATDVQEVSATFRRVRGIPQYLALPQ